VRGLRRWTLAALVLLAGCGGEANPAPVAGSPVAVTPTPTPSVDASTLPDLPASALPGYVVHETALDVATISTDALAPQELRALLGDAGFRVGLERRFTARAKPLTEVVARVLRFGSAEGARSYLGWIRGHGVDLLGSRTRPSSDPGVAGAVSFAHGVSGCCTKDTFQYFSAWTRGAYAVTLRIGGPHAGARTARPLAAALDRDVRKETR
jgi:hypothetical protein